MPARGQESRHLALGTALGPDKLVIESVSGNDALARPFEFRVVATTEESFKFDDLVGTNATVRFELTNSDGEKTRYFNGYVSQLAQTGYDSEGHASYELTLSPWLWFLTRTSDCRIFQNLTVPEILEQLFGEEANSSYELDLRGSYPTREYCVQYRETTFNFVQRLMEHEGIYYYWKHEDGSHKMVLCDSMDCHEAVDGFDTLLFAQRSSGGAADYVLETWAPRAMVTPGAFVHNSFDFKSPTPSPNTKLLGRDDEEHGHVLGNYELYDNAGDFVDRSDGERLATIRRQEAQAQALTVAATTNARSLVSGTIFTPEEIPETEQNVEHLVVSSAFQIAGGGYRTGGGGGGGGDAYKASFTAIPSKKVVFRPSRATPIPVVKGPQTAIVVGPEGEEIHVDEFGRIKLQFLWDRYGNFDDGSSCWIRVAQVWAGGKWGGISIPRVGQEVVCEFLEGDPDRPLVTGRVYNGDHPVPYDLPKDKTKTTFKSRSTPDDNEGHNEWRFEDKKGKEQIYIHAQKNMDVRIRNNLKETNYGNRHERIGWKTTEGSGGSHFVTVRKDENIHIEENQYETVEKDANHAVVGELLQNFQKSQKVKIGEQYVLTASEGLIQTSSGLSLSGASISAKGTSNVSLSGRQVILEGSSICLKSGGNFISIGPTGVQIKGTLVAINSGGMASSAQTPASPPSFEVEKPFDASVASESTGGTGRGYSGSPRTRESFDCPPHTPPPYTPPPDTPSPLTPVQSTSDELPGPCVDRIKVKDKEGRPSNSSLILEVVTLPFSGNETISFEAEGEKECGCSGPSYVLGTGSKVNISTSSVVTYGELTEEGTIYEQFRRKMHLEPKREAFQVTCDADNSQIASGEIRVYPGSVLKLEWDLYNLIREHPRIARVLDTVFTWLSRITGRDITVENGLVVNFSPFRVEIPPPSLKFKLEGEWREFQTTHERHWECYYKILLGFEIELSITFKVDIIYAVGSIPQLLPLRSIYSEVKSAMDRYLNDGEVSSPPLYLGTRGKLSGGVELTRDPDWRPAGIIKGEAQFILGGYLKVRIIEIEAEAACGLSNELKVVGQGEGASLEYDFLKLEGCKGKVALKIDAGWFGSWGSEKEVQLINGMDEGLISGSKPLLD